MADKTILASTLDGQQIAQSLDGHDRALIFDGEAWYRAEEGSTFRSEEPDQEWAVQDGRWEHAIEGLLAPSLLGGRIRRARNRLGLTQVELARQLQIPQRTLAAWEAGSTLRYKDLLLLLRAGLDPELLCPELQEWFPVRSKRRRPSLR